MFLLRRMNESASTSQVSWNGWNSGKMIDDCVGVQLSYLSLKDKFKLESVSKQWQRKIFWSVRYLNVVVNNGKCYVGDMNGKISHPINAEDLRIIFKKCHNIECLKVKLHNSIITPSMSKILNVIAIECKFLSYLKISCSYSTQSKPFLIDFFLKCGSKLKKLEINGDNRIRVEYYSSCVNLEEIIIRNHSLVELSQTHFPKLKSVEGYIYPHQITSSSFVSFSNLYAVQLKRIELRICFQRGLAKENFMQLFIEINKFVKLQFISIDLSCSDISNLSMPTFSESQLNHLRMMNIWKNLKELKINSEDSYEIIPLDSFYQSYLRPFFNASHFHLESLKLGLSCVDHTHSTILHTFPSFPKLKTLIMDMQYNGVNTLYGFYDDMHLRFPNLKKLYIEDYIDYESFFTEIALMPQLESLQISTYILEENDEREIDKDLNQFMTIFTSKLIVHSSLRNIQYNIEYNSENSVFTFHNIENIIKFAATISSIKITFFRETYFDERHDWIKHPHHASNHANWQQICTMSIRDNLAIYFNKKPFIMHGRLIYTSE